MKTLFISMILSIALLFQSTQIAANVNIYANTQRGMLSPVVQRALPRVYVPNGRSGTVSVIDTTTYKVVDTFRTGREPQHVVPAYNLQTLWVLNNRGNSLTPIDPNTGKPGKNIPVHDPYNLYFTPDGKYAIVVCEGSKRLEFHDPITMKLISAMPTQCKGANHMEFTADGRYAIVTCEFSAQLMKVDMQNHTVVGYLQLAMNNNTPSSNIRPSLAHDLSIMADGKIQINDHAKGMQGMMQSMPQDIRSSPDGKLFYVADMMKDGLFIINPESFKLIGFIATGIGTHAIYPSRDGKLFYVSNRGCHHLSCGPHGPGSISVIDPATRSVVATWHFPQGGSPDMGNVTADGKELWLAGRYDNVVYVFDTIQGKLTHAIPVGYGPHGLTVWPQPGRYSLGHTGNMR